MRAIRHWNRFLELAPADPRAEDVLFSRSLAYTKLGGDKNFEKAAADYESILSIMDTAAIALARENHIPIIVYSIHEQGGFGAILRGGGRCTVVAE